MCSSSPELHILKAVLLLTLLYLIQKQSEFRLRDSNQAHVHSHSSSDEA